MQNRAKIVLDFHGTFVTPGHVYWRAGGTFAGRFTPLIDIQRDDGVIRHQDGTRIRAATGCEVGSPVDQQFWAFLTGEEPDGDRVVNRCQLRFWDALDAAGWHPLFDAWLNGGHGDRTPNRWLCAVEIDRSGWPVHMDAVREPAEARRFRPRAFTHDACRHLSCW